MSSKSVPLRQLGKNGPSVPALGFGLMGLSYESYGSISGDEERVAVLDRAYELGATFWDSSDLYGDNEELLAKWFKRTGKRDEVFLATKFGFVKGSRSLEIDSSGEYCKKACAESLRILGIDSIDLCKYSTLNTSPFAPPWYYSHKQRHLDHTRFLFLVQIADYIYHPDYMHHANPKTPIEQTMRAMAELKAEGKIKHIGLSAISSATLRRAFKIVHVDAVQVDYSPFVLAIEGPVGTELLATCRELGVAVVAAMPLGRGMVTSTFANGEENGDSKDKRPHVMPRFMKGNREKNVKIVGQFMSLGEKKGCTTSQLALAWLLKQGDDVIPIPGTKKLAYLEENWAALNVHLTDEDEAEIRQFVEAAEIAGHTLTPAYADYDFRDTAEEV